MTLPQRRLDGSRPLPPKTVSAIAAREGIVALHPVQQVGAAKAGQRVIVAQAGKGVVAGVARQELRRMASIDDIGRARVVAVGTQNKVVKPVIVHIAGQGHAVPDPVEPFHPRDSEPFVSGEIAQIDRAAKAARLAIDHIDPAAIRGATRAVGLRGAHEQVGQAIAIHVACRADLSACIVVLIGARDHKPLGRA